MDDTKKMLQMIINGQSVFRQEVLGRIDRMEKRLDERIDRLDEKLTTKIDSVEKNLTKRVNIIGKQLAYLEDDTPTREEFDDLEQRVKKVEQKITPPL